MNIPTLDQVPGYRLYIGGFIALRRPQALANCHITHIISVLDWHFDDASELIRGYQHLHIPVDDVEDENLLTWFPRSNHFIEQALKTDKQDDPGDGSAKGKQTIDQNTGTGDEPNVFIHCAMGKSRSATIILAYLLWHTRRMYNEAISLAQNATSETIALPPKPLTVIEALTLLRRGRAIAEPNEGFMDQLYLYYDMGCPDRVENHRLYKRWMYQRSVQESLSVNQAPEIGDVRFEDEAEQTEDIGDGVSAPDGTVTKHPGEGDSEIKCRKCRRLLAKGSFIIDHSPTSTSPSTSSRTSPSRPSPPEPCAHIFLHPLSWMKAALSEGRLDGRLTCPNGKCGANVGKFAWQGFRCSCGDWVTPGFGVVKARVDEVRSNTARETPGLDPGGGALRLPPGMMRRGGAGNL